MKDGKRYSRIRGKGQKKAALSDEVMARPQSDSIELAKLIFSFQNALAASDHSEARRALAKVEDAIDKQFRFEKSYLYPRLRRLTFEIIKRLTLEQRAMERFIRESKHLLRKSKVGKNQLFALSKVIPILSSHIRDCNDLVIMANKFSKEEKVDEVF